MTKRNFPLRLQPSLMEEARRAAESQYVTLNQLFNVAVAEKLSALRTEKQVQERTLPAKSVETPGKHARPRKRNSTSKRAELPVSWQEDSAKQPQHESIPEQPALPSPALHPSDDGHMREFPKAYGKANPQFGELKKRSERFSR